jgi:hypothetical protein
MFKSIAKIVIVISISFTVNVFAAEFCSEQKINQKIVGTWKGSDSYALQMRINNKSKLCISLVDEEPTVARSIRDIIIVSGKLKHLSYYTPSTEGYVVYSNIEFTENEMKFYWYSSYDNQSGEDSYFLVTPKPEKGKNEVRARI